MKLKANLYEKIKNYACQNPLEEVCGFIVEKDGCVDFVQVENRHPNKSNYALVSPKDYLKIKNQYCILYYFHSHPCGSSFSETDLFYQKFHNMDMIVYDVANNIFKEKKCKIS